VTHRAQIVLIHGLTIPSLISKDVAPTLISRGNRVLLYGKRDCVLVSVYNSITADLYGHGYSDAPEITFDASPYAAQLALLVQRVKWPDAYVGGISMACSRFACCCCSR
jgi:pimeloyl-ACP methyl ester carboxylesterase